MPVYDFLIFVNDEREKEEGDIITIRPHGHNWGKMEVNQYLVVPVKCRIDFDRLKPIMETPLYEYDHLENVTFEEMEPILLSHVISLPSGQRMLRPLIIGKRKFKIPLEKLGYVNIDKIKDKTCSYQPFLKKTHVMKKISNDVECSTTFLQDEEERIFDWNKEDLIKNKSTNEYVKPSDGIFKTIRDQ